MNTYVAIIGGKAVLTFRAVDDDQAHAEASMRSDLKVLVDADGNRCGMESPPFRSKRRRPHSTPSGKSFATKQLATGKST
jgi:hypothetical protein